MKIEKAERRIKFLQKHSQALNDKIKRLESELEKEKSKNYAEHSMIKEITAIYNDMQSINKEIMLIRQEYYMSLNTLKEVRNGMMKYIHTLPLRVKIRVQIQIFVKKMKMRFIKAWHIKNENKI